MGASDTHFELYRLFGDANGDYVVDAADVSLVRSQMKVSGSNINGDIDGDMIVGGRDLLWARRNRGKALNPELISLIDD